MDDFRPDSYCGLFCGACEILNLHRRNLETGSAAGWETLPARFRDRIPPAEPVCLGCKTGVLFAGCQSCPIRICASARKIEACSLCGEYPCEALSRGLARAAAEVRDALPHTRVMFRNLDLLETDGLEGWVEDQCRRWCCPDCGTPFTWYQETCRQCGRELESIKDYHRY